MILHKYIGILVRRSNACRRFFLKRLDESILDYA